MAALSLRWWFLFVSLPLATSVDHKKFRNCEQTAFCRRFRSWIGHKKEFLPFASDVVVKGHSISAQILLSDFPITLTLQFFRSQQSCGVVQATLNHASGESIVHHAVVRSTLEADDVEMLESEGSSTFKTKSGCQVVLQHQPFQLQIFKDGFLLQTFNARHFLNYERHRQPGSGRETASAPVARDAADVDPRFLWEESFDNFVDHKFSGPTARGFDVTFEDSMALVGLPEHATALHLGKFSEPYRLYNLDVFEYEVDVPMALYGSIPMVTCVHGGPQPHASGFLALNPSEGFVQVDDTGNKTETWRIFETGPLELYFFFGPSVKDVLRQYHDLTGLPRMVPLAALGKHQSRWNYITPQDVMEVTNDFDRHGIPLDFVWLDLEHTDGKRYFTWDPKHFPLTEVQEMLDALNRTHRKLVTIIDPHLFAEDPNYRVAQLFKDKQLVIKKPTGEDFRGFCWPGPSIYPDFCSLEARDEWAKLFDFKVYPTGQPAELYTWNDMNEPSVFDGPEITLPKDMLHRCGNETVEHREVHNLYGFWVQEATVAGHLYRDPSARPFVLTRSFFADSHRHGAAWTGDNMANWRHLERSVPMLLSLSLCGLSMAGADVAGFMGDPDSELFVRWHQLGIWYPFYRAHAHLTSKRREPWLFGTAVLDKVRESVLTRYRLLPMWYTLAAEWALLGSPMIRPIWYDDLEDSQAFSGHVDSHFFVGDALLVRAPETSKSVKLYLPGNSTWYDFWREKPPRPSGSYKEPLHKYHVPVFVRSGHCLVQRWRARRSTGAMATDPYTIVCYGQPAKGRVYIDDGRSHAYQQGAYIFDEILLDSTSIRGRSTDPVAQGFNGRLRVERLVLLGWTKAPSKIMAKEPLQFRVDAGIEGYSITVREPQISFGSSWSINFHF